MRLNAAVTFFFFFFFFSFHFSGKKFVPPHFSAPSYATERTKWQHKNATKKFDYTAMANRLRTVSWSN